MNSTRKLVFLLVFLMISQGLFARVDEFNTYRWNRKNVLAGNGKIDKSPWFEWWYYKVILPETGESFFFIYGVVNPWDVDYSLAGTRAYVEMGDFASRTQVGDIISLDEFQASYDKTQVDISNNHATDKNISGQIISENAEKYYWDISIQKKWTFNATGWATGRGITNIEWYSAQADATCNGVIESNGNLYHLVDAPCYQDRNWGTSFPKWWTWIVSNHFVDFPETTLSIGGGLPTYFDRNLPLKGIGVGLKHRGKVYEFRPNDFDIVRADISFGKWEVSAENLKYKLEVSAFAPREEFMDLQFMTPLGDIFHDFETLSGKVTVKIFKNTGVIFKNWTLEETIYSNNAGIEYGSRDLKEMFELKKR